MKVGEYVRTNDRGIRRIGKIIDDIFYRDEEDNLHQKGNLIKSSPNIIDLIEKDDLIKIGYEISTGEIQKEVLQVIKNNEGKLFVNTWIGKRFLEDFKRYDIGVFSILTKEQFSQNEYRIGE